MPAKNRFPILPYLDPKLNPDHPENNPPEIKEDPWLPFSKRERTRLEKEVLAQAMENYSPPHVPRSWETDAYRAEQRKNLLEMVLLPKNLDDFADLVPKNPYDSSVSRKISRSLYVPNDEKTRRDFRQFAAKRLHLGYNRFHASHGDPNVPSEEADPALPPEEICWIMEYTYNECNNIRRQIAQVLGIFPAVTDPSNQFYDEEIAWRYERRLYARCRRRNQHCIRPSHIEIFTSSFKVLP